MRLVVNIWVLSWCDEYSRFPLCNIILSLIATHKKKIVIFQYRISLISEINIYIFEIGSKEVSVEELDQSEL